VSRRLLDKQARKARSKIAGAIASLRRKAAQSGSTEYCLVAGWSFALDIGLVGYRGVGALGLEEQNQILRELKVAHTGGDCDRQCGETHVHCHFSARLYPLLRSSGDADWHNLGLATSAVGMPEEAFQAGMEQVKDDTIINSRALHYFWTEPREGSGGR